MTDYRLERVLAAIHRPGPTPDLEPDCEAEWEVRRDPDVETDRAEDMYDTRFDQLAHQ